MAKRNQLQEQLEGLFSDLSTSAPPPIEEQVAPAPKDDDLLRLLHREAASVSLAPDTTTPQTLKAVTDLVPPDPQPAPVGLDAVSADTTSTPPIAVDQLGTAAAAEREPSTTGTPQRRHARVSPTLKLFLGFLFVALVPLLIIMVFGRTPFVAVIALAVSAILAFQMIYLTGWTRSAESDAVEQLVAHEADAPEELFLQARPTSADTAQTDRNIELEQTVADLNRQANDLTAGAVITRAVASCLDPQEVIQVAVDTMQRQLGLYNVSIYLSDKEDAAAVAAASSGESAHEIVSLPRGWDAKDDGLVAAVWADGQAHHSGTTKPEADELLPGSRSELALPLTAGGRMLGVVDVHSTDIEAFGDADARTYQSIADMVALSLHNARRHTQKKRQVQHREMTARLADRVARENELEGVVTVMLKGLSERFDLHQATLSLGTEAELMVSGNRQTKEEP